jgi:outer membrane protein assembly factor BamB
MRRILRAVTVVGGVAATVAATLLVAPAASAAFSPIPVGPIGWVPDGPVRAVVSAGDAVYVGGAFTGGVAALDASTGALRWTATANRDVRALAMSPDGSHVLAGGAFTSVSGATHKKLASLRVSDGEAEPTWNGAASGTVRDIVVEGNTAYFGGTFSTHGGMAQAGLGAVSVDTGALVSSFTTSTDANVYGLATDGTRLYFAGNFTVVDGQPRASLASVTMTTGSLDSWQPARGCSDCNTYWDITVGQATVYVVGRNGAAVYAVDATSGAKRWSASANGDAQAVTLVGGLLYVGGHFATIAGQPRKILAAFDATTGALDAFSARFVTSYPGIWALAGTDSRLYVGGAFTAAGPTPNRFPYFAMFGVS